MGTEEFIILPQRSLMFIDDDDIFLTYIEHACKGIKEIVSLKKLHDGAEALELFEKMIRDNNFTIPDVIFVDVNMPRLDGFGFLKGFRILREKSKEFSYIKCVAMLSSSEQERDKAMAYELGADQYIVKPSNLKSAKEMLIKVIS